MEVKDKILEAALMLFYKFGIKGVTMDDIAKEMGISKKTIYRFFNEKDDIVTALCEVELKKHAANFEALVTESKDPVHEMILIYHHIQKVYSDINPVFFYDLHKSFTKASSEFDNFKKDFIYKSIYRNIEEGIKQELYRNDLDINFVTQYRVAQMDLLMTKDNFNLGTMSYAKAHQMVMDIFMHGISTVKGHKLINKYKNKHEEE